MHMRGYKMDFQICSDCCQACSCMNLMLYALPRVDFLDATYLFAR